MVIIDLQNWIVQINILVSIYVVRLTYHNFTKLK